ncbi:hypothetical protein GO003_009675 [Methylicorpusculum oleiharenae]|uniref:hypothetical protein n=1 Tax=Methylicorpusculum oleiharenae TaxID=1338687 RepID=UPI0013598B92|nr:hypothetical protein [Methylicorpusculum oleiharenae]MCD2450659.1 hypothetical protein [Methylicorpusculum oleiharenae]
MALITLEKEMAMIVVESMLEMIDENGHEVIKSCRKRAIAAKGLHTIDVRGE